MSMDTLNIIIACFLLLSLLLMLAGIIVSIFLPEQMGGKIKRGRKEISSLTLGLPLIFIGVAIFLLALEPAYDHELRERCLEKVRCYLWADKLYIISGGKHKTDKILVDDDLRLVLNGQQMLLNDKDRFRSDYVGAIYKGEPIIFFSDEVQGLRVLARDVSCCTYSLSPLYLHRPDGTMMKLTDGVKEKKYERPTGTARIFFDEIFELAQ